MAPAPMGPAQWSRLSALFAEALELPEDERAAKLADTGLDDADRRALADLLAAHFGGAPLGIERWLAEAGTEDPALDAGEPPGGAAGEPGGRALIGPYRLLERLGEGGMGEVWLATRDEPGLERPVALKRLRAGLSSEEHRRRFAVERAALGRLSHRGIALLLDGGFDAEGLPYLVLEYVRGLPITEACDARRLPVAERLELFGEVCDAVRYAHAQLIVHRDLKPSNILVTGESEIRLLDFGIAKLLDPDSELGATRTALRLATPEYASPEQLEGAAVSTATDVYALGVLLCELIAGRRPFADREGSARELDEATRALEPPRPSELVARDPQAARAAAARGTSAESLAAALRGDLDTIVLKALHKEPGRRYGSVEQLADDIRRYLGGMPILARPDTAGYRLRKFVGRHRAATAAAAAAVVLLLAFAAYAFHQSGVVARERDLARAERDKAREVSAFLVDLFGADPYAYDGLRDSTTLGEFLERSEVAVRHELAGRPALRAVLLARLARLHGNLGRLERARALAEEAVAIERAQAVGDRAGAGAELAESLTTLATVLQEQGEYAAAETLFAEALARREALHGDRHPEVAESVHNLAVLLAMVGDPEHSDELERLARRGLALRRELFSDRDPVTADSLNVVGFLLLGRGGSDDLEEAERLFIEVLEIRRRELGPEHPAVATALNNLANLLDDAGRESEAVPRFREAIRIWSARLGPDHPRVAIGLYGLAEALADAGDPAAAEEALRASLAIDERALPPGHPYLAGSYLMLGRLLVAREGFEEAEPELRRAWESLRAAGGDGDPTAARARSELGDCLLRLDRAEEAGEHLLAAHRALEAADPPEPEALAASRERLGRWRAATGRELPAEAAVGGAGPEAATERRMSGEVTTWLARMREGDGDALDRLVALLYDELRTVARRLMRGERRGRTLATTALVHETYLRLLDARRLSPDDRGQFLAAAAVTMRRILVDRARRRLAAKRGAGTEQVEVDALAEAIAAPFDDAELVALDDALERLGESSPRARQVVELRFFTGLTLEETAQALDLSKRTVQRDWLTARAWLRATLAPPPPA